MKGLLTANLLEIFAFVIMTYLLTSFFQNVSASPSFVHQEVSDASNDYLDEHGQPIANFSNYSKDCKFAQSGIPIDIRGVSYRSDGNFLNSTIWLKDEANESSSLDQSYNGSPTPSLKVFVGNFTSNKPNLQDLSNKWINQHGPNIKVLESIPTVVGGIPSQKIFFDSYESNNSKIIKAKTMLIIAKNNTSYYIFEYVAAPQDFSIFLANITRMVNSFDLVKYNNSRLPTFELPGGKMQYPPDWQAIRYPLDASLLNQYNIVTFVPKSEQLNDISLSIDESRSFGFSGKELIPLNAANIEDIVRSELNNGSVITEFDSSNNTDNNASSFTVTMVVTRDNVSHRIMQKYFKADNEIIDFAYEAPPTKFDTFLPSALSIINSLELIKNDTRNEKNRLLTFESTDFGGIKIQYPVNWHIDWWPGESLGESYGNDSIPEVAEISPNDAFLSPRADNSEWFGRYSVYIDILSTYDRGVDYVYDITRIGGGNWTKSLMEVSSQGDLRKIVPDVVDTDVIHESENFGGKFVNVDLDMKKIGSPSQYNILFIAVASNYGANINGCYVVDGTNFISLPPSAFTISPVSNEPLIYEKNHKYPLEIQIRSQALSSTTVFLFTNNTDGMGISFSPNPISIPPSGTAISKVEIDTKNAEPRTHTVPLFANVSSPTKVSIPAENITIVNPQVTNITKNANLTITVKPPLDAAQQMQVWLEDWFNPLTGAWTTVTTIASGILGWSIWKKKRGDQNQNTDDNKKTPKTDTTGK